MTQTSQTSQTLSNQNPGLEPYDITDYKGVHGKNFFDD